MTQRSNQGCILQIHEMLLTIDLIEAYLRDHDIDSIHTDHKTISTLCYNLRLVGEAAGAVPREVREKFSEIPWVRLRNLRNPVSNEHFRTNPKIMWMTCTNLIFPTAPKLAEVLRQFADSESKAPNFDI